MPLGCLLPRRRPLWGGDAPQPTGLFDSLVNWVENGVAPDHVVASQGATSSHPARTTKICKYPDQRVYVGPDPNNESSYACQPVNAEPADLRQSTQTARDYFQSR